MRPIHKLKINPESFCAVVEGRKFAEFRINDRDFRVGDTMELHEYHYNFTGDYIETDITHIQTGYGIPEGYVVLSFAIPIKVQQTEGAGEKE
jgi:hypothetical protein